eukprot:scaffold25225_cov78-Cyclotella_meneghiniana.AAC.1
MVGVLDRYGRQHSALARICISPWWTGMVNPYLTLMCVSLNPSLTVVPSSAVLRRGTSYRRRVDTRQNRRGTQTPQVRFQGVGVVTSLASYTRLCQVSTVYEGASQ